MKKTLGLLLLLIIFGSKDVLASEAYSRVETKVAGEGPVQIYQYAETTIYGQTVRKESSKTGKLEIKMEKTGDKEATFSVSEEPASPSAVQSAIPSAGSQAASVFNLVTNFFGQLFKQIFKFL